MVSATFKSGYIKTYFLYKLSLSADKRIFLLPHGVCTVNRIDRGDERGASALPSRFTAVTVASISKCASTFVTFSISASNFSVLVPV